MSTQPNAEHVVEWALWLDCLSVPWPPELYALLDLPPTVCAWAAIASVHFASALADDPAPQLLVLSEQLEELDVSTRLTVADWAEYFVEEDVTAFTFASTLFRLPQEYKSRLSVDTFDFQPWDHLQARVEEYDMPEPVLNHLFGLLNGAESRALLSAIKAKVGVAEVHRLAAELDVIARDLDMAVMPSQFIDVNLRRGSK